MFSDDSAGEEHLRAGFLQLQHVGGEILLSLLVVAAVDHAELLGLDDGIESIAHGDAVVVILSNQAPLLAWILVGEEADEMDDTLLVGLADHKHVFARRLPEELDRRHIDHGRDARFLQHRHHGDGLAGARHAEHRKGLVDLDDLLGALDGACRDVAVVFQQIFDLAAVDAAGIVGFRNRDPVSDRGRDAEKRRRSGQGFDVADHDLCVGDAGIGGLRAACAKRACEQQGRGRKDSPHLSPPLVSMFVVSNAAAS